MAYQHNALLCCPIDGSPLVLIDNALGCEQQHSFDVAKRGYVNLLVNQHKRSNDPGDSKEMVVARQAVLSTGVYQPILDKLCNVLLPRLPQTPVVVDAGCGEGYYLEGLWRKALAHGIEIAAVGLDISKWAVIAATKRCSAAWLVGTNRKIPMQHGSADVVLDIFGFACPDEFARVLKPGGLWLRVGAGNDHLMALRKLVYPEVPERTFTRTESKAFKAIDSDRVQFALPELAQPAIDQLFMMTPHYFRAPNDGKARLAATQHLAVSADVIFEVLQRC